MSWMDGLAICALMNALFPGSCPLDTLKGKHKVGNCRLGLYIAEKILDIPEVCQAVLCVMCALYALPYLSFPPLPSPYITYFITIAL